MSDSDIDVVNISNSEEDPGPSITKKCRRSYTIAQYIEAIEENGSRVGPRKLGGGYIGLQSFRIVSGRGTGRGFRKNL